MSLVEMNAVMPAMPHLPLFATGESGATQISSGCGRGGGMAGWPFKDLAFPLAFLSLFLTRTPLFIKDTGVNIQAFDP